MQKTRDFDTEEEKKTLIAMLVSQGFALVEEQYHFDGKHLVFENDEPEPYPRNLAKELDDLRTRVEKLEKASTTH